jgi:hypothetical protein
MTRDPRLVRALVACYPAGWRRRYGDEYAQLLCDMRVVERPALILDSLFGAVRAHGGALMSNRSPMAVAVWAVGLFTVAGIGFQKLAEDFTGIAGSVYGFLIGAAALALLGIVVAAAPSAWALVRGRDPGAWKYLAVPIIGSIIWYGVLRVALSFADGHRDTAFVLVTAVGIAVVAGTAWAATVVLRRVPAAQPARLRPVALLVVAAGMAATTVAALIWGLQVRSSDPTGFRGDNGILGTPFVPSWIAAVVLLAVATGLAATASRRQLTAARERTMPRA